MTAIPAIATVIPAAGVGKRMQADKPKQYLPLCGLTVLEQTLHRLKQVPALQQFYLALSPDDRYFPALPLATDPQIQRLDGGAERAHSVLNALLQIEAEVFPWVLVHDAARPVVRVSDIELLIQRCIATEQGGILATPVRDTMKRGSGIIQETIDRSHLWHAYTPQLFPTAQLREALQQALAQGVAVTDEASAMEWAGWPVLLVQGHADNIKITQAEDLALAAFYLEHSV
ncbi:2-C-methyl-D-erythritol 4-phosphate cytidylyltransferase [Rheinheimera mesophila]|uniref:2-C-methyl-D-erythritol 4-phosphate cytidylyltransferase n=1 Tax=Rheinheimera mesophila TaxID=1547515 RepID=A0A3P3QQU2_9GAMM|nr:2-C-methyl-D-erythritol 4-phosphate cytidylyltransferase [Rheinheimera mesophila]KKL03266.1 2-C-methyl-D-erythritol 4-phosphate cytidylyltransferase [Rheinheimera mesophila]RRJ23564.1 2-C-methyl-D-erythritol 4-phosphate cytidylyltransferase [Rheinheimera mesophila]